LRGLITFAGVLSLKFMAKISGSIDRYGRLANMNHPLISTQMVLAHSWSCKRHSSNKGSKGFDGYALPGPYLAHIMNRPAPHLLSRSTSPSLWLCLARLGSCFELFYQLSCLFQFRFIYPGRVLVYLVLHNFINRSFTNGVVGFPRTAWRSPTLMDWCAVVSVTNRLRLSSSSLSRIPSQ
jgi:hypothetical protein